MLKFKTQAEFDRWQRGLAERPKLRVAASLGERVVADAEQISVSVIQKPRMALPSRAAVTRWYLYGCWALLAAGALGTAFCVGALCGAAHVTNQLM